MSRVHIVLAGTLAIALAAPAAAQITFDDAPKTAQPNAKGTNKIICEREDTVGSRLGARKVCMTAEQWREQKERHREQVEKFQQQNTSVGTPAG